jgi:hypothetical protein
MDNNFEFSLGAIHQTPTNIEFKRGRVVHSKKTAHSGGEEYKFGYANDVIPCPKCKDATNA